MATASSSIITVAATKCACKLIVVFCIVLFFFFVVSHKGFMAMAKGLALAAHGVRRALEEMQCYHCVVSG